MTSCGRSRKGLLECQKTSYDSQNEVRRIEMKTLSKLQRYGLATISWGVALAVAWPIDAPVSSFLLAVMVSGLFGGLGPGLLSVGLSALSFEYFFLRRTLPPAVEPAIYLRFAV